MFRNKIIEGDSARVLKDLSAGSVDLVVTDPPYLVSYCDRDGAAYAMIIMRAESCPYLSQWRGR